MNGQTALERRVANLERMVQISRALGSAFDLQSLLKEIMRSIVELAHCERSSILLIDPETRELYFAAVSGTDFEQIRNIVVPRQGSIAGTIAETRQPLVVHHTQLDPRFFSQVDQVTGQSTQSIMGIPLEIGGRVIGVLQAVNKLGGEAFDNEDVETLLIFASQAAAAIENTRLLDEQRQRLTEVLLSQEVLLTLSRFIRMDQLLDQLLVLLEEWLGYSRSAVLLFDREMNALRVVTARGFGDEKLNGRTLPVNESSVCGRVAKDHRALNIPALEREPEAAPLSPDTYSVLAVPMLCGEDVDLVGVITLESPTPAAFSERDVRLLTTISTQAAIGIRQAELYEASDRANQLKQEFIATMSHELRTPMTVIIGYCDMLLTKALGPLSEGQVSALQVIHDRADLLLRLLNDVVDFSKIISGALKLQPVLVNLTRAIQFVTDKYRRAADRKRQTITVRVPLGCQYVMADDQRLCQVLGHLVENAIKFSPDERPIVIEAHPYDSDYIRIDVIDQGIGIKPEDTEIVFEDFRQLDSSFTRDYGGAGMGLAISKHLVHLQGGLIWVESEFGKGSTFSFILPRPAPSDQETIHLS